MHVHVHVHVYMHMPYVAATALCSEMYATLSANIGKQLGSSAATHAVCDGAVVVWPVVVRRRRRVHPPSHV